MASTVRTTSVEVNESDNAPQRPKWTNRERVLVLCSRGSSARDRHLMLVRIPMLADGTHQIRITRTRIGYSLATATFSVRIENGQETGFIAHLRDG